MKALDLYNGEMMQKEKDSAYADRATMLIRWSHKSPTQSLLRASHPQRLLCGSGSYAAKSPCAISDFTLDKDFREEGTNE